jgi:hypothetical protein
MDKEEAHHVRDICKQCGATRTYTRTKDGFMLGGQWIEPEGDVVKRKGLDDERKGKPY